MRYSRATARTGMLSAIRFTRLGVLTLTIAGLLAACSGSAGPSNGVARLDSPDPGASAVASADPSGALSPDEAFQAMLAYSQCMRTHGVTSFPDPVNDNGRIGLMIQNGGKDGLDPNSTTFQAAQQACQSLMPARKTGNGGVVSEKAREQALQFSQCMRDHGVTDFPDPQFSSGGNVTIGGGGSKGAGLDPNAPTFQAAQQACQSLLPGSGTTQSTGAPTSSSQP